MIQRFLLILFLFIIAHKSLYSQGWVSDENTFETNWNLTVQFGRSALLNEWRKDFSSVTNDMNNLSDWSYNFQLAKMAYERLDFGIEFGVSNFKGYKSDPSGVNYLTRHPYYNNSRVNFVPYPIYYDSDITNFSAYAKYNFINFSTFTRGFLDVNVYAKLGFGVILISAEMGYQDYTNVRNTGLSHPIYVKGRHYQPIKSSHTIIHPAFGANYQVNDRVFLSVEADFNILNADMIDGVHNYDSGLTPNTPREEIGAHRIQVYDVVGKFMFGVSYFFNFDSRRQVRKEQVPFFKNEYTSYYSQFHKMASKKARKLRIPFYKDKEEN